jgi:cbb3-type cytochrome oxidase subunit 1
MYINIWLVVLWAAITIYLLFQLEGNREEKEYYRKAWQYVSKKLKKEKKGEHTE